MSFLEGDSRDQINLLPTCVDDYVTPDALVRVVGAFVCESAWGPDADRRANHLILLTWRGILEDAYSHSCYLPTYQISWVHALPQHEPPALLDMQGDRR